ncbi:PAS domain S-box-containing protein [Nannocystis exedens]|uniref:histidine kinase n=1 Tax=Nannocystis exedens TaxID=54 RepID=A0A1I2GFK9_9BACT|nr:PAS domain-containing sensor histidine kinase [Nannocystis exedens]PCC69930.1 Alkaline phosphatase synthesis sensor protein PhoR [Nannocystis exedens]SFF16594.1 PAS domain S-box-containing protein [Nannocystis exedens]
MTGTDALEMLGARDLLEALPHATYVCDLHGRIVAYNADAAELLRLSSASSPPYCPADELATLAGAPLRREDTAVAVALRTGARTSAHSYALSWRDGRQLRVRESARPVLAADGSLLGAVCVVENLRETAVYEAAKAGGLAQLVGIFVSDMHGELVEATDEYLRILGYTRDELEQGVFRWDRCTAPEHLMRDHQGIEEALRTGKCRPYEKDYVRRDGSRVPVLIGYALVRPQLNQFIGYVVDLSTRLRELSRVNEAMRAAETGVWDWDVRTGQAIWSDTTKTLLGMSPDYQPQDIHDFIKLLHPDDRDRVGQALQHAIATRSTFRCDFRLYDPEFRDRWLFSQGGVFSDYAGQAVRMSGTLVDISARKQAEQVLRDAIAVRDEFLSVASHELRTPITSILLRAESLLRKLPAPSPDPAVKEPLVAALQLIIRQARKIDSLVGDMLDATRLSHKRLFLEPQDADVCELLTTYCSQLCEHDARARAGLRLELPPRDGPPVMAAWDRRRIEQVLDNLVSNAFKYGANHPVTLRLMLPRPGTARIEVEDHGIGIAPEARDKLFQPFERAHRVGSFSGLGLGLYIAREIVHAHHGSITLESEPGVGTTFRVDLPLVPATS